MFTEDKKNNAIVLIEKDLKIKDISGLVNVSKSTLYNWKKENNLKKKNNIDNEKRYLLMEAMLLDCTNLEIAKILRNYEKDYIIRFIDTLVADARFNQVIELAKMFRKDENVYMHAIISLSEYGFVNKAQILIDSLKSESLKNDLGKQINTINFSKVNLFSKLDNLNINERREILKGKSKSTVSNYLAHLRRGSQISFISEIGKDFLDDEIIRYQLLNAYIKLNMFEEAIELYSNCPTTPYIQGFIDRCRVWGIMDLKKEPLEDLEHFELLTKLSNTDLSVIDVKSKICFEDEAVKLVYYTAMIKKGIVQDDEFLNSIKDTNKKLSDDSSEFYVTLDIINALEDKSGVFDIDYFYDMVIDCKNDKSIDSKKIVYNKEN